MPAKKAQTAIRFGGGFMIVRRRTWLYRLAGQTFAQMISFKQPVTASIARATLRRTVGNPSDLWGRSKSDLLSFHR
jgi:hypothetical protein